MEAFKVNVDLILLRMDHQYVGLHLHSFQMEQRRDELLLMKLKDYLIEIDCQLGGGRMKDQMNFVAQPNVLTPPPPSRK